MVRRAPEDDHERDPLEEDMAQRSAEVVCPACGEGVEILLDPGSGPRQEYVEDCQVCCRPWVVRVRYATDGRATVEVALEGED